MQDIGVKRQKKVRQISMPKNASSLPAMKSSISSSRPGCTPIQNVDFINVSVFASVSLTR